MSLFVIALSSIIVLILVRALMLIVLKVLALIFKYSDANLADRNPLFSIIFLVIYIQGFFGAVLGVSSSKELSDLEWYIVYTCMGVACIVWCYFKWELSWKALPKLEDNTAIAIKIKKIIVYSFVMIISFHYGYGQTKKLLSGNDVDGLLIIANATIIPGIIALDRVFNQIQSLRKHN